MVSSEFIKYTIKKKIKEKGLVVLPTSSTPERVKEITREHLIDIQNGKKEYFTPSMGKPMTIYISGPITGTTDFVEKFQAAEDDMLARFPGATIRNPVKFCSHLPPGSSWEEYMEVCRPEVKRSTHIFMMPGWEKSRGALEEKAITEKHRLVFL